MINAFPKSRCVAWTGGAVLGAAAGISAWLYMAGRAASLFNRAIVALLPAFIAVNIALYIARLMAAREYQKRLLLLYEALDPSAFLQALLPLRKKRMDASNRCTTLVHIANGYLYGGRCAAAGEGAGDAGSCGRQQSYLLSGGGRDGSGADSHGRAAAHCSRQELQKGIRTKGAPYAGLSAALHGYCPGKARRCGSASKGF